MNRKFKKKAGYSEKKKIPSSWHVLALVIKKNEENHRNFTLQTQLSQKRPKKNLHLH